MKCRSYGIFMAVVLLLPLPSLAADVPTTEERSGKLSFSLLPKSLQKNPEIDCNIVTEVTPAGKKIRPPSPENPAYYVLQAGYYQSLGEAAPANVKPPPVATLERAMKKALATGGYLEAAPPEHPPRLLVVFTYGDHSASGAEIEQTQAAAQRAAERETAAATRVTLKAMYEIPGVSSALEGSDNGPAPLPPELPPEEPEGGNTAEQLLGYVLADPRKYRELLDRAALVAGAAFANELKRVLEAEKNHRVNSGAAERTERIRAQEREYQRVTTGDDADPKVVGAPGIVTSGPFHGFYNRNARTMHFLEDAFGSCYFVIASAYDGAALAKGERKLLWRTKMSLNSSGVSMSDTMPTLIISAGPHFGRATKEAVVVTRRTIPMGRVELGEGTVVDHPEDVSKENPDRVVPKKKR